MHTRPHILVSLCIIMIVIIFSGCRPMDLYEKNTNIPELKWSNNFNATGTFNISDTSSAYNIYVVLRHTDAYAYNNIWLEAGIAAPGDSFRYNRINLVLGTDAKGWEGSGMNDIWEVRKLVSDGPRRFRIPGEYRFSLRQIMRDDPLENVMSAGLRIEKATEPVNKF